MATDKQTEANQLNAQHCTGPTSPEGKETSSQNALKHGLYAKSSVIRGEDPAAYEALKTGYYNQFTPASQDECFLVERLIAAEWMHRRCRNVEIDVCESRFDIYNSTSISGAYANNMQLIIHLHRRLDSSERSFDKARKELLAIQAKRAATPVPAPAPTAAKPPAKPLTPESVSFRQNSPTPIRPPALTPETQPNPTKNEHQPPIAA